MMSCGYISSEVDDEYEKLVIRMNPPSAVCSPDEQSLEARALSDQSMRRSVGVQDEAKHTSIELIGRDRPGLLSEIFAVLTDLKCNVVAAEVWTHNSRLASVVYVTDEVTGAPIDDSDRLSKIRHLLRYVLKGNRDNQSARTAISMEPTHAGRRLHQMMLADQQYPKEDDMGQEEEDGTDGNSKPLVTVENCIEKEYTVVNLRCKDRPKLLFDTEYYIRKMDGCAVSSEGERKLLIKGLEAAIERRSAEGLRLELCCEDRVGLLSDVTRIFRENGLSVIQAEVSTRGSQAVNVFYVVDASGKPVQGHMIDAVRSEIGQTTLHVRDAAGPSSPPEDSERFSLGDLFRSRSEKFLYNLGLIRS
ncbi:hypothetical protein GW17_00044538 [Ensete ventricosum]|nr:hypothetical protein GW17_00044538 [Ensete ventricosum]